MKNIEKYKDIINHMAGSDMTCCVNDLTHKGICLENCTECKRDALEWLLSEYKESILDDIEREYLSAVIRPFRKNVNYILKVSLASTEAEQFIKIIVNKTELVCLPFFNKNSGMYKGMQLFRKYTVEELGL